MSPDLDLVEQLAAAADAVRARCAAIESGADRLHSVMIEVELANGGDVLDVRSRLSWKDVIRQTRTV